MTLWNLTLNTGSADCPLLLSVTISHNSKHIELSNRRFSRCPEICIFTSFALSKHGKQQKLCSLNCYMTVCLTSVFRMKAPLTKRYRSILIQNYLVYCNKICTDIGLFFSKGITGTIVQVSIPLPVSACQLSYQRHILLRIHFCNTRDTCRNCFAVTS